MSSVKSNYDQRSRKDGSMPDIKSLIHEVGSF